MGKPINGSLWSWTNHRECLDKCKSIESISPMSNCWRFDNNLNKLKTHFPREEHRGKEREIDKERERGK